MDVVDFIININYSGRIKLDMNIGKFKLISNSIIVITHDYELIKYCCKYVLILEK